MKRSIIFPSRFQTIPQITTVSVPNGNVGIPYSFQFTETGGTYPFTWSAVITPNTGGGLSINPVTGVMSGTPTTGETETVTVTVTDNMTPHNSAKATFTFAVNTAVVITTTSLPNGTVGVPYGQTLNATGGTPPYTWSMSPTSLDGLTLNSASGSLAGTPTSATTVSGTFTATDSLGIPSAPVSLSLTVTASGVLGPQSMWPGALNSNGFRFAWWPPSDGSNPDSYNVYRTDMPLGAGVPIRTGIIPQIWGGGPSSIPYPSIRDTNLTPGTGYSYFVTAVYGTTESAPGPTLSITTLGSTGITAPTPPTDPATYIPAYSLPTGTVWTATQNNALTGSGTLGNVGCGFGWALNHAASGDLIVLSSGVKYNVGNPGNGHMVNITQSNLYIISDNDPVYNASGTLRPYSYVTSLRYTKMVASGAIAANAQSLTLASNFTGRTGWYTTVFQSANPPGVESRQALYTNGSTSVVWNVGLQAACTVNFLAGIGNYVTPWDAGVPIGAANVTNATPSMPVIEFQAATASQGNGISITGSNVRLVGLCVQPVPNINTNAPASLTQLFNCISIGTAAKNVMIDRCVLGRDNTATTRSWFARSIGTSGSTVVIHQCYCFGADQGAGTTGGVVGDANAINPTGGGPFCIQNNYLEAVGESVISGGAFVSQANLQHDYTLRYNWSHRPTSWQQLLDPSGHSFSRRVKNHFEAKCCARFEWYGNIMQNNALLQNSQGQGARGFVLTPRDQVSANAGAQLTGITWAGGTATATSKFQFSLPIGSTFSTTISGATPGVEFNGTFAATVTSSSTFTYPLPTTPSGPSGSAATLLWQRPPQSGGMWESIYDGNIHDNQEYCMGSSIYIASDIDYNPVLYAARIKYHNNLTWLNPPFTDDLTTLTPPHAMEIQGHLSDIEISNNTVLSVPSAFGYTWTGVIDGLTSYQSGSSTNNVNTLADRVQVTDNIFDGNPGTTIIGSGSVAPPHNGQSGGTFVQFSFEANRVWNGNLFIADTSSGANAFPVTTYNPVAYGSVGFNNFISNTTMPTSPSDWNVVSGPYATGSSTGGPVGSQFDTLATDLFPRTAWLAIAPVGNTYASAGFSTNAAKYNLVITGPFMGLEQSQGATFATIFGNIKTKAAANGVPTRCLHYTMSSEQSTIGGGGNGSTYTVWSSKVNTTNWWIRTSYPAGSIVLFDANSGVLAQTSQNSILDSSGNTFAQAFWNHYDGVLRQGNAVSQGYSSSLAFAANPNLDGYQMDNMFVQPRSTGAWQMNTTSFTSHWPNSADAQISTWIQQAQASQVAALRAINPNMLVVANSDYFIHSTGTAFSYAVALDSSQAGLVDAVLCESCIGGGDGIEGQTGNTTAGLMANLAAAEAQVNATGTMIFIQSGPSHGVGFSSTNQAVWTTAEWRAVRFGLACCFMRNYHYLLNNNGVYRPDQPYFTDETLQQGGKFGWLGNPVDAPQSAPRTSGVWYRVFSGGVVFMNPAGNGTQTINLTTLGLTGKSAIASNGFGDNTINTGAPVTSITLQDRDGRFLIG